MKKGFVGARLKYPPAGKAYPFGWLVIITLLLVLMVGCAHWDALTPDEKARATVDLMQTQLEEMFDQSKLYVDAHPEYLEKWKTEIVPAFDVANKTLLDVINLAKTKDMTASEVRAIVQPLINRVVFFLGQIGLFD